MVNYSDIKEASLYGRYIVNSNIELLESKYRSFFEIEKLGTSVNGLPIYLYKIGKGKTKVLAWSQMHGNESTTTKALFDFFNRIIIDDDYSKLLLSSCTLYIIPILNPDGALAYTRVNANSVDLNRDAQQQSQPESRALMDTYKSINPDYCFNLHGQRTIFSAGYSSNSSVLSFLSPAENKQRSVTDTRKRSMEVVVAIKNSLESDLSDSVSRYNDAFNIDCVGDAFQVLKTPTVLFEAGHFPGDYNREKTRYYVYKSLMAAFQYISKKSSFKNDYKQYFELPENQKLFYDIIIRNVVFSDGNIVDVAIQYEEALNVDRLAFKPKVVLIGGLDEYFGHKEIDGARNSILINNSMIKPCLLTIIDEISINGIDFVDKIAV